MAQVVPAPVTAAKVAARSVAEFQDKSKPKNVREANIIAAKAVADAVRTSLGPKGMDKMIQQGNGEVTITNDGATILKQMQVAHPAAKMLVELSKAQDVEAGDGTTSVVVLAGALLDASWQLLGKGIHAQLVSDAFAEAATFACGVLERMAIPIKLDDRDSLLRAATTSLNSKVVSQHAQSLAPIAVDSVLRVIDPAMNFNVNLADVRVIKKLGGTVDDTEMVEGLVLDNRVAGGGAFAVRRVEKARIAMVQFCVSAPKTDMENNVIVSDYSQMDRVLKEERAYILNIVKRIKAAGCNVLFVQKSILRDALSDLAVHFFEKMKVLVVKDVERDEIDFVCKTLGCRPIASLDHFTADALASADLCEEVTCGTGKIIKVTGIANRGRTVSVVVRGSNKLVLDEAERSLHDALCVIRCLVKKRAVVAGGAAAETEMAVQLQAQSHAETGVAPYAFRAFAQALEVVPFTLAENAGLNPIATVTELRNRHAQGEKNAGINVRRGAVTNMLEENVLQPLLVSLSAVQLSTETVRSILKIDDVINAVRF